MAPLVDSVVLRVAVVPLLGPVLADLVVLGVILPPALALLQAGRKLDLPFLAPLLLLSFPVDFAPFLVPLLLRLVILAPLLAVAFVDLRAV